MPGLQPNVEKALLHDLAGQRAGQRGVLARGEQRARKERAGKACAQDGAEKLVSVGDFRNVVKPPCVESRGTQNENRGIDKKRKPERSEERRVGRESERTRGGDA